MQNKNEIKALFQLLDDPDDVVFSSISERIISLGTDIIPKLEEVWLNAEDQMIQQRIESLIQKVSLSDIKDKFSDWEAQSSSSLFEAMILLNRYAQPNLEAKKVENTLKSIHRSCWLELNNYLTPLEEIHIINSIFYSMYSLTAERNSLKNSDTYYLNNLLEQRKGNQFSLALLYLLITQMLDIPVFALKISNFVVLGYVNTLFNFLENEETPTLKTQFFIEPTEGTILSKQDVDSFIKKYKVELDENSFKPLKNREFILHYSNALARSYDESGETDKAEDIRSIVSKLHPDEEGES